MSNLYKVITGMQLIERFISLEVGQLFNVIVLNVQTLQLP